MEFLEFKVGDRIVSNGPHADVVTVKKNLCARIPDEVDDDSAAFTVVGSIALQGVRLAEPYFRGVFRSYRRRPNWTTSNSITKSKWVPRISNRF